ncbi:MAG: FecR family protein [Candidatus Goldiibacteriota bacterium]
MTSRKIIFLQFILTLLFLAFNSHVLAQNSGSGSDNADYSIAYINDFDGDCNILRAGTTQREDVNELYTPLYKGDTVETGPSSKAEIVFDDETIVKLDESSSIAIADINRDKYKKTLLDVIQGCVFLIVKKLEPGDEFQIKTKMAIAAVKGTEFAVQAGITGGDDHVAVYDGRVRVASMDNNGNEKENTFVDKNNETVISGHERRLIRRSGLSDRFASRRAELSDLRARIMAMRELKRNGKIREFKYNRRLEHIQKMKQLRNNPAVYNKMDRMHKARIEKIIKREDMYKAAIKRRNDEVKQNQQGGDNDHGRDQDQDQKDKHRGWHL